MSRWKAATIHLSISITIGVAAALLIFGLWYPPPYSQATGAPELVMLLLGVDLVLGPLLTLAVFKAGKKGMAFDLCVIGMLQACALVYGLSVVARARPVYVVAAVDRFVLVTANSLDREDLAKANHPKFRSMPWTGPHVVGAEVPTDAEAHNKLIFSGFGGKDIEQLPQFYVEYAQVAPALLQRAKPLDTLRQRNANAPAAIDAWLRDHQREGSSVVWLPIAARTDATMLLDHASGQILDALLLDPW